MGKEYTEQLELFEDKSNKEGPVTCLGMTFENDEARRAYFTEELRKKLPELRQIEGFPIGEDEDILALSDPPYYTACPNPFINDFVNFWEEEKKELSEEHEIEYHREPFAADVSEGKNDPIYNAHAYHTKVPHKAIMKYLAYYTNPGDIVFDGFCGTGMTGVAAQAAGKPDLEIQSQIEKQIDFVKWGERKAVLVDLSTSAGFISYNYNIYTDMDKFKEESLGIISEVEKECEWMYKTKHVEDGVEVKDINGDTVFGRINYTIWSDVYICPACNKEIIFWDIAVDDITGQVKNKFYCNHCGSELTKKGLEKAWESYFDDALKTVIKRVKQLPVSINYKIGNKRLNKKVDKYDLELIDKISSTSIPYWYPIERMPEGDESRRNDKVGVTHVHHFYTKRNLYVLSCFLNKISNPKTKFAFTASLLRPTLMYKYTPTNKGSTVSGTYYIPTLRVEIDALRLIKDKVNSFLRVDFPKNRNAVISTSSSTNISQLMSNSIDYIFIDPPFGSNLMYSELSFIWESWLNIKTNNKLEAIISRVQDKNLYEYQHLMEYCFKEMFRILKNGRWMTVEFSNSQARVWNAIQESIQRAGFVISNVSALDKQQLSFKALTTTTAVKQDLVISAYKPTNSMIDEIRRNQNTETSAWIFVRNHLEQLPVFMGEKGAADVIVERTPRVLFDRMVAYHVQNGYSVPISSAEFQYGVTQRFPMRDGMVFLENQVAEYDKKRILAKEFVQMSLLVSDENSAIEWIRQQLIKKPQTRQDLHPNFMKEIQHISDYEKLPELDTLLEQNFLKYEGTGLVPSQIHSYLSTNFKELRELSKEDPKLQQKAKDRWYIPDPNKQVDLDKLREKSLLREFNSYVEEIGKSKKKLKQFRLEAIRAGFKKAWGEKDYKTIVEVGAKIPENVLQEDDKLLMYYDNAQIRLGM